LEQLVIAAEARRKLPRLMGKRRSEERLRVVPAEPVHWLPLVMPRAERDRRVMADPPAAREQVMYLRGTPARWLQLRAGDAAKLVEPQEA